MHASPMHDLSMRYQYMKDDLMLRCQAAERPKTARSLMPSPTCRASWQGRQGYTLLVQQT